MERPKQTEGSRDVPLTSEEVADLERRLKSLEERKEALTTFQSQFEVAFDEIKSKKKYDVQNHPLSNPSLVIKLFY